MHHRTHSGGSSSQTYARSLVDSPGDDSHSDDSSGTASSTDDIWDDQQVNRDEKNQVQFGNRNEAHTIPLHAQPQQQPQSHSVSYKTQHSLNHRMRNDCNTNTHHQHQTPTTVHSLSPWSSTATADASPLDPDFILGRQHSFDSPMATTHSTAATIISKQLDKNQRLSLASSYSLNNTNPNSPLVLGSGTIAMNNNKIHRNHGLSSSNHGKNMNAAKNDMLKNLLSTVQFPRPRMPFSPPLLAPGTSRLASSQETKKDVLTAASFAKNAPKAGYLSKLGGSVSEYKKRFFVLKPTTCLYYFLSPSDEEPRGCIDLDGFVDYSAKSDMGGLKVNSLGTLPDGRFRFECVIPPSSRKGADGEKMEPQKILLEARNEEIGKEWMHAMTVERLSYSKATCEVLKDQLSELENETKLLERRVEELHLVEKDLEGALQDAKVWKKKVEDMDQGMLLLKRYLLQNQDQIQECGKNSRIDKKESFQEEKGTMDNNDSLREEKDASHEASYFFTLSEEELDLDSVNLPGTHFSSLVNACRGLRENLRLTSLETTSALEDLKVSNEKLCETQERLEKAEKYVCKLWEENCTAREKLRRGKSEKKVLVNEIRSLMKKSTADDEQIETLQEINRKLVAKLNQYDKSSGKAFLDSHNKNRNVETAPKRHLGSPEVKFLSELEDDINTTLVQHEYLLFDENSEQSPLTMYQNPISVGTESITQTDEMSSSTTSISAHKVTEEIHVDGDNYSEIEKCDVPRNDKHDDVCGQGSSNADQEVKFSLSPLFPKQLSLMDQLVNDDVASISTSSNVEEVDEHSKVDSTMPADAGLIVARSANLMDSAKSLVTDSGKATSKIMCPMKDVLQSSPTPKLGDGKVYSLTFHTARIGLQFQKVPRTMMQRGSLSDALCADIGETNGEHATCTSRTEAELRVIASISESKSSQKVNDITIKEQNCPVIFPKDYVLVCGFQGFDDVSGNRRPSLGARLVGFDGISIERGPWTFDAVRKAIKARGRPLTLTFRDDFLTSEQRSILTKAIHDIEQTSRAAPLQKGHQIPVPSTINARILPSSQEVVSKSSAPHDFQSFDDSTTVTDYSRFSDTGRSLSDTGSSSIFSSKFTPLAIGLVSGIAMSQDKRKKTKNEDMKEVFTPEYFRRSTDSLETTPNHRNFKASLL